MKEMIKYFDLKVKEIKDRYMDLFGFSIPKGDDLTFQSVKKDMLKLVKKNKDEFIKLVDDQLKKYKKLMKKL